MTKSELIDAVAEKISGGQKGDAEVIVNTIFNAMTAALASGDRIEIRGFGSFQPRLRKERLGRNPKSGHKVRVNKKRVPFFRPGKELREKVNIDDE